MALDFRGDRYYDDDGNWHDDPQEKVGSSVSGPAGPTISPGQTTAPPNDDPGGYKMIADGTPSWEKWLKEAGGSLYDPTDLAGVQRQASYAVNAGKDPLEFLNAQKDIYAQRNASTNDRTVDSQSSEGNRLYGSGTGNQNNRPGGPMNGALTYNGNNTPNGRPNSYPAMTPRTTVPAQFSDPISKYLEQFAQTRAQQLENPSQGSGQNLYEDALRSISSQFGQGGFTNAQQETLNTQAIEPIEQLRQQRKQSVMQQLSASGIDPRSGVGMQRLADVDRQFDQLITQQRRSIANQATTEQQQRMMESISLLQNLAGTENSRLDSAYNYRTVPYNMSQQAFQNASGLYNQGGNPLAMIQPLLALAQQQGNQQNGTSELLGYIANMIANGG